MKKLYRSRDDRVIAGIFGGVGKMIGVDPTILRVAYLFIAIFTWFVPGTVFYFLAALVIPKEPAVAPEEKKEA